MCHVETTKISQKDAGIGPFLIIKNTYMIAVSTAKSEMYPLTTAGKKLWLRKCFRLMAKKKVTRQSKTLMRKMLGL